MPFVPNGRGASEVEPLFATIDQRIEAALLASHRPIKESEFANLLPEGTDVRGAILRLEAFWRDRGGEIRKDDGGWALHANVDMLPADQRLGSGRRLSEQAIATLAVIAMHQPITVKQIETVRGVKLGRGVIESLVDAGLVGVVGRRRGTGQAIAYGTTGKFLERAGLNALSDLPTPEEAFALDLASS